ncbi:TRAP transporter small permease subunit [Amorphus sp. 3PC139-8]|uniref:TRAP transporter small permease subunit n=1 Tax=Amorphus sp. 3PC139-8 TaxID=2735676 RepID=UPI00345DEBDC
MALADFWRRPVGWLHFITMALNLVATAWIVVLLIMINLDVFSLNVVGRPIVGVKEAVGVSIAGIVFLQLAETLRSGRHIRSDMFLNRMKMTRPRIGQALEAVYHLTGGVLMAFIVWFAIPIATTAYQSSYYVGTPGVFTLPTWPVLSVVVLGAAMTMLQFLVLAASSACRAFGYWPDTEDAR